MSILIFGFWFLRVMTISLDNQLLRFGVPVLLLSLIFIFVLINRRTIPFIFKSIAFRNYLFLLAILIASTCIAYLNKLPLVNSISALVKFLLMGGFFVLGFILCTYGKQKLALFCIALSILMHLLFGLFGYFLGFGVEINGDLRPTGIAGQVNILANLALFACVFYGARSFCEQEKNKIGLFLIALIALIMIFFSGTLTNVGSLIGAIVVYAILGTQRKFLTVTLMIVIATPIMYFLAIYTPIGDRIIEAVTAGIDVDLEEGDKLESSLQWRVLHWKLLLDDWYQRFAISGAGFGQIVNLNALKTSSGKGYSAHSDWIEFWVELGPILFILFIWGFCKMLSPLYKQSKLRDPLSFALFFAFISQCIAMLGGPVFFSVSFFYYFWVLLGICSAIELKQNLKKANKPR